MAHQTCRICRCDEEVRNKIEEGLVLEGKKFREVAKEWQGYFLIDLHLLEQSIGTHYKKHLDPRIKAEDLELLRRFEEGAADSDEMLNKLSAKMFEGILRNQESVKMSDWLRLEKLKIRKEKLGEKENFALDFTKRLFAGHLPAKNCIKCGHPFFENYEKGILGN